MNPYDPPSEESIKPPAAKPKRRMSDFQIALMILLGNFIVMMVLGVVSELLLG